MYSGTTLHNYSGNIVGTHQKVNRVARRMLVRLTGDKRSWPSNSLLLHFEGRNGPDGIKSKSPGQNEPWHFYDPFDPEDEDILYIIRDHYKSLVKELKSGSPERIAFEATWLSHAIVDGLTPAHHYPFEEELMDLRGGEGNETRVTLREKVAIKGSSKREVLKNNWKMWGSKGLMSTHVLFEGGVAVIGTPLRYSKLRVGEHELAEARELGIEEYFKRIARQVALLNMYERFYRRGWTTKLAREVRDELLPTLMKTVTVAWYMALADAKRIEQK